jgi:phage-related protein
MLSILEIMDMFSPITTRIGSIAQRNFTHALLGRAGHGVRQMVPEISNYSGPASNSVHTGNGLFSKVTGALGGIGSAVGGVGKFLGTVEGAVGSAIRIGKAVEPFLPVAAAI